MKLFEFPESILCPQDNKITKENRSTFEAYYTVKYQICANVMPKRIAEIGVRAGYSAWSFLQAAPKAEYIGFDANNGTHGGRGGEDGTYKKWAEKILAPYRFRLVDVDTQTVAALDAKNVDLFHVDGDHTLAGVQHDLSLAYACLSPRGFILIDDIDYISDVKQGVTLWIAKMRDSITYRYIVSLRGEMLIQRVR